MFDGREGADGQFAVNHGDHDGILGRGERPVHNQGVAAENTMLDHPVTLDRHEKGRRRMLDEMLIETEAGAGADDGEHADGGISC